MSEKKVADRIMKLLNKANDPGTTDAERETFLAKAHELQHQHRIDDAKLRLLANDQGKLQVEPIVEKVRFADQGWMYPSLHRIAVKLSYVCGIKIKFLFDEDFQVRLELVGYPNDVEFFKMVWQNIYMHLSSTINPTYNEDLSEAQNIRIMYESGIGMSVIADRLGYENVYKEDVWAEIRRAYRRECQRQGVRALDGRVMRNRANYQMAFLDSYTKAVCLRLMDQFIKNEKEAESSTGAELALLSDEARIQARYWELHPEEHPDAVKARLAESRVRQSEKREKYRRWYASLTEAQKRTEDKKVAREKKWSDRENQKNRQFSEVLKNNPGATNGRKAGESVDISGGRNAVVNRKGLSQ